MTITDRSCDLAAKSKKSGFEFARLHRTGGEPGFSSELTLDLGSKGFANHPRVLKTAAFIEKILLLFITAALTGIMVPEVAGRLSDTRYRKTEDIRGRVAAAARCVVGTIRTAEEPLEASLAV